MFFEDLTRAFALAIGYVGLVLCGIAGILACVALTAAIIEGAKPPSRHGAKIEAVR